MNGRVPRARRVDATQLRALFALTVSDLLRAGTDATTGVRGHPLKQILFSMGFLGVVFAFNVRRFADAEGFVLAVFLFAPVTLSLAILPDTFEVRERKMEILRSKPVTGETFMAGRAAALLLVCAVMATALSVAPLVALVARFDVPAWRVLPLFAGLLAAGFTALLWWLVAALAIAERLGVERLRTVTQTTLVALTLALVLSSFGGLPIGPLADLEADRLSGRRPALAWLPPAWFAAAGLPGGGPAGVAGLLAAVAFLAGGLVLNARLDGDRIYARFAEQAPRPRRNTLAAFALRTLTAAPPGSWLLPGPARGVARLVLSVGAREEVSRMKSLAPRLLVLVFFVVALVRPGEMIGPALVAIAGLFALIDGFAATRQSALPAAAWVLHGAPLPPRHVMRGLRAAIALRYFALPLLLLAVVLARTLPPLAAALLVGAYAVHGSLVVSLSAIVRPALPLSQDQTASPGVLGLFASQVLGLAAGMSFLLLHALAAHLGGIGVFGVAVLLVPLTLLAFGCRWYAVERLKQVEFAA